jgi:hypothetical protein
MHTNTSMQTSLASACVEYGGAREERGFLRPHPKLPKTRATWLSLRYSFCGSKAQLNGQIPGTPGSFQNPGQHSFWMAPPPRAHEREKAAGHDKARGERETERRERGVAEWRE